MRVAVIGSRKISDYDWLQEILRKVIEQDRVVLVSGGSEGVDTLVHKFAKENNIDSFMYKPHFLLDKRAQYSPRDFFTRYRQIIDNSDQVVVIVDTETNEPDLEFAQEYADKRQRPLFVISYK